MGIFCKDDGSGEKVIGKGKFVDGVFKVTYYNLSDGSEYVGDIVFPSCPPDVFVNNFSDIVAAYSLQLLNADFVGEVAITLERLSDNTTQNFAFDSNGQLPWSSILSFSQGGHVDVSRLFNQAALLAGLTLQQTDPAKRFRLVEDGALVMLNGKPSMKSTGASEMFIPGSDSGLSFLHHDPSSLHIIGAAPLLGGELLLYNCDPLGGGPGIVMDDSNFYAIEATSAVVYRNGYTPADQFLFVANVDPNNATPADRIFSSVNDGAIVNINPESNAATVGNAQADLILGNWDHFQELVVYNSNQNINNVKTNRNNVYGIW